MNASATEPTTDPSLDGGTDVDRAVALARALASNAQRVETASERRASRRLASLLSSADSRDVVLTLTDQVARIENDRRAMRRLADLVGAGLPRVVPRLDRLGLRAAAIGRVLPSVAALAVRRRLRAETARVIGPADDPGLARHVAGVRARRLHPNLNLLGEAILGDDEAEARTVAVCAALGRGDVDYVSVKISALCANLDVGAFEASVERIAAQLRRIYRAAMQRVPVGFVNLDMEEYRDLHLTLRAFTNVLDEPEFSRLDAGIVMQAYLPDTSPLLSDLAAWAVARYALHGAAVKVRLVKGANLAMELVDAEVHGWPSAPYATKADVDANFKRLLAFALDPAHGGAMRVGVASHNLFDIAWALVRARELGVLDRLDLEMLDGMAPAQARAVREQFERIVLYTPVVRDDEWTASLAYLARRLDENATPDNFLHSLLELSPAVLDAEERRFRLAVAAQDEAPVGPSRSQDRFAERAAFDPYDPFANEADTDLTLAANRRWADGVAAAAVGTMAAPPREIGVVEVDATLARSVTAQREWAALAIEERRRRLGAVVDVLRRERGATLALLMAEGAKTIAEGDPEVSEAIDAFAAAATESADTLVNLSADGVALTPAGPVLVCGPWNFPYAIPSLGIASALIAGCSVILKPAPEVRRIGIHLVEQIRRAGFPDGVVQCTIVPDDDTGRHLVTHDAVGSVVLTGSAETAVLFLSWKPSLRMTAETSGKNALVITQAADLDAAIKDLLKSAFGHAGQKCSAASLAIVEGPVYDDARFLARLADATRSLRVGAPNDPSTMVGPLIAPACGPLLRALTILDEGERWLLAPTPIDHTDPELATLWTPGVKVGVRRGSWFHRTECFGPVLGVMRADDLDDAIDVQNDTGFGLTGGIASLDPGEITRWTQRVEVGNAYVNRPITGAIVRRQPFGGWKRSSVGGGPKPGGPDHVLWFARPSRPLPSLDALNQSAREWWERLYGTPTDPSALRSERNELRHRPLRGVLVVGASVAELTALRVASEVSGTPIVDSVDLAGAQAAVARYGDRIERVRLVGPSSGEWAASAPGGAGAETPSRDADELRRTCHAQHIAVDATPVTGHGRVELGRWMAEQSVSVTRHRYGRLLR